MQKKGSLVHQVNKILRRLGQAKISQFSNETEVCEI